MVQGRCQKETGESGLASQVAILWQGMAGRMFIHRLLFFRVGRLGHSFADAAVQVVNNASRRVDGAAVAIKQCAMLRGIIIDK